MHQFLTRMFSERISSWPVCSGCASVPDAYAQHFFKGMRSVHALVPDAYAQCTHQFLTRMLSVRISSWRACSVHASSSWRACSVHASIPCAHAKGIQNEHLKIGKLTLMLSMRVRNWCVCSGCASVPDPYAQRAHKGWSMRKRNSICSIILKYLKHRKWSQKLHKKKNFCPNSKQNPP